MKTDNSNKYGLKTYYDSKGWEIRNGDILKVYHFSERKRVWYMFKIAYLLPEWGWVGIHTGTEFDINKISKREGTFNLSSLSDKDGYCRGVEIISKDVCFKGGLLNDPKRIKITPPIINT